MHCMMQYECPKHYDTQRLTDMMCVCCRFVLNEFVDSEREYVERLRVTFEVSMHQKISTQV